MLCYFSVIFCEAVAIYGVIVAIILQTKLESVSASQIYAPESLRAGYAIFASGIIVGFANLVCGFDIFSLTWFIPSKSSNLVLLLRFVLIVCSESFLMLCFKAVCGNHWKQLCVIRCPKLLSFCENSCN